MVVSVVISIFGVLLYENRMKNLTAAVEMTRKCKSLDTGQSSSVDINADKNIAYGHVEY